MTADLLIKLRDLAGALPSDGDARKMIFAAATLIEEQADMIAQLKTDVDNCVRAGVKIVEANVRLRGGKP